MHDGKIQPLLRFVISDYRIPIPRQASCQPRCFLDEALPHLFSCGDASHKRDGQVSLEMNSYELIIGIMHVSSQRMDYEANRMMKLAPGLQIRNDIESLIDRWSQVLIV